MQVKKLETEQQNKGKQKEITKIKLELNKKIKKEKWLRNLDSYFFRGTIL